jgi:hypothetical protein
MAKESTAGGSMDKAYMLDMLDARIEQLQSDYKQLVNQTGQFGAEISYGSAKTMRSNNRRAYGICKLLYDLVYREPDSFMIDDPDEIKAFDRLVEPKVIIRSSNNVLNYDGDTKTDESKNKIASAKRVLDNYPTY